MTVSPIALSAAPNAVASAGPAAVVSPLTGAASVTLRRTIPVGPLIERWQRSFGVSVARCFQGIDALRLYACDATGLEFFAPDSVAGDGDFYARLSEQDWYYSPWKWEHAVALRELRGCRRVLEVGCGRGDFLAALTKRCGCETEGLELNPAAVAAATAFGRQVAQRDVVEHAAARPGNYDAVCAFQVLEHVPKTRAFLEALVTLVRPGGRLILGVPDHDNYLGRGEDLVLDMPPHHCTRWRAGVFRALERLLPVRVERVVHEPLQAQHVDCYLSILNDSDRRAGRSGAWRRKLRRRVVGPVLTHSRAARWLVRGHTLYARLRRLG